MARRSIKKNKSKRSRRSIKKNKSVKSGKEKNELANSIVRIISSVIILGGTSVSVYMLNKKLNEMEYSTLTKILADLLAVPTFFYFSLKVTKLFLILTRGIHDIPKFDKYDEI